MRIASNLFTGLQFQRNPTKFHRMAMFSTISKPRTVVARLAALAAAGLLAYSAASTQAQTEPQAIVANRITQPINPDVRVTLQHNMHPLAQAKYDQGAAPGSMATGR